MSWKCSLCSSNASPSTSPQSRAFTIGFDGERPSSARALVDGEVVTETELDPEALEWALEFAGEDPGYYEVELVVEGTFPDRLGHLYEQDALEFSDTKARAEWDVVVVTPDEQVSTFAQIWSSVKGVLALYTLTMIVRKAYSRAQNARTGWARLSRRNKMTTSRRWTILSTKNPHRMERGRRTGTREADCVVRYSSSSSMIICRTAGDRIIESAAHDALRV